MIDPRNKAIYPEADNHFAEMRAKQAAQQETASIGAACARPPLRERVASAFYRAQTEARKCDRLKELAELMDANPALARIFELLDSVEL